jgi:hypothetical protein
MPPLVQEPKKPAPRKSRKPAAPKPVPADDAVYPELEVRLCVGSEAITAAVAKDLLGWQVEGENGYDGADPLLTDRNGKKVRATNNVDNRPLYSTVTGPLTQEIVRRRWKFNGEPVIIGKTGKILNGQHTLVSIILADQIITADPDAHPEWKGQTVSIDKLIVFGVDEDDAVVNTMDTCKPRSLADVIYRSSYFASMSAKDRKQASGVCKYALRLLWDRTGQGALAHAPYKTHAEFLDMISRHEKILEAVKTVIDSDSEGKIKQYVGLGYAAGLMYLMATSESDGETYRAAETPSEAQLDFSMWDKAEEFWTLLGANHKSLAVGRMALANLYNSYQGNTPLLDRVVAVTKLWEKWKTGKPFKSTDIDPQYTVDEEDIRRLAEFPILGGIDVGTAREMPEEAKVGPADIAAQAAAIRRERNEDMAEETPVGPIVQGEKVWVNAGAGSWRGLVETIRTNTVKGKEVSVAVLEVLPGFAGAGTTQTASYASLQREQPEPDGNDD